MDLRLEAMSDELSRSGNLFVLLFRNEQNGMSCIRFVTKDRITRIDTAENDWETELAYTEISPFPSGMGSGGVSEERTWYSPTHPCVPDQPAIMLHYSANKVGASTTALSALLGESDLTTMIPWLQRYSRMLEDRVRLHSLTSY